MSGIVRQVFAAIFIGSLLFLFIATQLWGFRESVGSTLLGTILITIYGISLYALVKIAFSHTLKSRLTEIEGQIAKSFSSDQLNFTSPIVDKKDEFSPLVDCMNRLSESLDAAFISIKSSVVRLKPMSQELAQASMGLSQRNQLQFSQSRQIGEELEGLNADSDTMTELSGNIVSTTENCVKLAEQSVKSVNIANKEVDTLHSNLENSMNDVETLQAASKDIGEAIAVIKGISEQTNLLALNAAIEAARAGEAGRGFAVVADEVRSLSGKTQESSARIESMVANIQSASNSVIQVMRAGRTATSELVKSMGELKQNFDNIHEGNQHIAQRSIQIETSITSQVKHTQNVTKTNQEMTQLNEEILNFSKMHGLSEKDLVNLGDYALKAFGNIQLTQTEFDTSLRTKKIEDIEEQDEAQQDYEDDVELF